MNMPSTADLFPLLEQASAKPDLSLIEGMRVASFDHPFEDLHFGRTERTGGIIGRIEKITPPIEGCARYEIRIEAFFRGDSYDAPERPDLVSHPPVNGTYAVMQGRQTFGVIALPSSFLSALP